MKKRFNITGMCNPQIHYMADISDKIEHILKLVNEGYYFTINRPHQYGKTTIQSNLAKKINTSKDSISIRTSFESIDYEIYQSKQQFINAFLQRISQGFKINAFDDYALIAESEIGKIESFDKLSSWIGKLAKEVNKKLVLIIDEVDHSSNNQLFLDFLAILRDRYLMRNENLEFPTFYSVVLSGVHDVKKLKYRIDPSATLKYNSPWNIAFDFKVDLCLNEKEILSMLQSYSDDKHIEFDRNAIAKRLFYYTSGHPFLVSYLCKIIDEDFLPERDNKNWQVNDVDEAFKIILIQQNTNFESLIKNLENNTDLYNVVFNIIVGGEAISYNIDNPQIDIGVTYGIFDKKETKLKIHNRLYEQRLYNYMISKVEISQRFPTYEGKYVKNNILNIENLLLGFQTFMQENHSGKNKEFLEKHGALLFLAFTKPVINGKGFDFKEVQISEERRLDVVITYLEQKSIIELKIWRGEEAHQQGLEQLSDYLDRQNLNKGYLLIYDFRINEKQYKHQEIKHKDKDIFAVWV